jgi:tripartite motif-containing protein 71
LALALVGLAAWAIPAGATEYVFEREWGHEGPAGIAVDRQANVYVAGADKIQKFTANGDLLTTWGGPGAGDGQFNDPRGIAIDPHGNVYVADYLNGRIQVFTADGAFIDAWEIEGNGAPFDLDIDPQGDVYVADLSNDAIQKYAANGKLIGAIGGPGVGDGEFDQPTGIAVDQGGNFYVADRANDRVQKFTSAGTFVTKWGQNGNIDGHFSWPWAVAVGPQGNVFVGDNTGVGRVQEFTPQGSFVSSLAPTPDDDPHISHLKRDYGLRRSRLKGAPGTNTWVGWGALAYNLDTYVHHAVRNA